MSVYNLKTVTDGLIFYFDTFNKKSYAGEPTNNCFFTPTPDGSNNVSFSVQGNGTFSRVFSGIYGGYEIQPSDVVYRYDLGSNGCHYHGNDYNIPAGNYVNFSFDYYVNANNYAVTNFLANVENGGNMAGTSFADPDTSVQRVWKRHSAYLGPSSGSGFTRFLLYPGGCSSSRLADSGYILFKNPQAEYNKQHATAFIAGGASTVTTRSNTQGLLDLIGNNVLDLTSADYDSNGSIVFSASKVITAPMTNLRPASQITQECWFSTTNNTAQVFIGAQYGSSSDNSYAIWLSSASTIAAGVQASGSFNYQTLSYTINTNTYYHFVHTYDGATQSMYMNGRLVKSWATTGSITYNNSNTLLALGNDWNSGYDSGASIGVIGSMPIAKIYNRALTGPEVLQNFNSTKGRFGL